MDQRPEESELHITRGPSLRRLIGFLAFSFTLAIAAILWLARPNSVGADSDFLALCPRSRLDIGVLFEVENRLEASALLLEQTGWRVHLPAIDGTTVDAVGFSEVLPGIDVPVVVYSENDTLSHLVSVASYAFLDTHESLFEVPSSILDALESEHALVLPPGDSKLLVWRSGDEIFVAATSLEREQFAVRVDP